MSLPAGKPMITSNMVVMKSIFDDPITSKICQLTFFSKSVRTETKKLSKFCEDMEHRTLHKLQARKNKIKILKKPQVKWPELSNDQKLIVEEKGAGEEYWHRMIQGPYDEKFSEKLDCVHMGIYRYGKREEWGKMVGVIHYYSTFKL